MIHDQMAVTAQPGGQMMVGTVLGQRDWSVPLFDCVSDVKSCCKTWCCTPCVMCSLSSKTGDCACMPFFVPGAMIVLRTRIRTLGGIQGSICNDCMVTSCCGLCAMCQMARELENMGL